MQAMQESLSDYGSKRTASKDTEIVYAVLLSEMQRAIPGLEIEETAYGGRSRADETDIPMR